MSKNSTRNILFQFSMAIHIGLSLMQRLQYSRLEWSTVSLVIQNDSIISKTRESARAWLLCLLLQHQAIRFLARPRIPASIWSVIPLPNTRPTISLVSNLRHAGRWVLALFQPPCPRDLFIGFLDQVRLTSTLLDYS
jgi:hypothetical protein